MDLFPTISAGADAPKFVLGQRKPQRPVLVALVHEVLNAERFTDMFELTDAVKRRAARLRIHYDSGKVAEAIRTVGHVRPVLHKNTPTVTDSQVATETALSRADAERIYADVPQRTGLSLRSMPQSAPGLTADAINQFKREHVWHR